MSAAIRILRECRSLRSERGFVRAAADPNVQIADARATDADTRDLWDGRAISCHRASPRMVRVTPAINLISTR
jgi:hypothetical protein